MAVSKEFNILLNPFNIIYSVYDCHYIFYFKDHPTYEAVEAMVIGENSKNPIIRAIITKHDKTQIDHLNDLGKFYKFQKNNLERKIYFTPIEIFKSKDKGKVSAYIRFITYENQELIINFKAASKVTNKYCSLIDPKGHSFNTLLPIMYPELNTIAASESFVCINGKKFKASLKIWIPFFFKAVNGYYSEQFQMGIIRVGNIANRLLKVPTHLDVGECWIYETMNREFKYNISEIRNNTMIINGENETLKLKIVNKKYALKEIVYKCNSSMDKLSNLKIDFNPYMPIFNSDRYINKSLSDFSISINQHQLLITGKIETSSESGKAMFLINFENPLWATQRPILINVSLNDDVFDIKTEIIY